MEQGKEMKTMDKLALEIASKRSLIAAMETGDRQLVSVILRDFKTKQGVVKFEKVLAVPQSDRIPQLAEKNFTRIVTIITAALTLAFESMNLKRGMNPLQIVDLAEAVIDTAGEDNLAMEDLMLFLQKLVRGEYGAMYESMDIPKFMTAFEEYREQRWQQLNNIRHEQAAQHKCMGDSERSNQTDELSEHFAKMGDRMSEMKSKISDLKQENYSLKMDKL